MLEAFDQAQIDDAIEVIAISGNRNSKGVLRAVHYVDDDTGMCSDCAVDMIGELQNP